MRQDILTKAVINRTIGGSITHKMERGTAGDLLFIASGGTWNYKDIITVKLRHKGGVTVVVDRVPALLLAWLCDTKKGRPSIGTHNFAGGIGEEVASNTIINVGQTYLVNAFKVPVGHISLQDAASELEITVDMAKAFGGNTSVKIANIEPANGPDFILQYDKSADLESTHNLVREMYLYEKTGGTLFKQDATAGAQNVVSGKDVNLMIYTDGGNGAYETDLEVLGANTSIDGNLSHSVSNLVVAYQDLEDLPTPSLRIKVSGDDMNIVGLLFIKEMMIQTMTSRSTIEQVSKVLAKTEAIEKQDPSIAKAYRHAGVARPSHELAEIKAVVVAKTPEA